MAVMAAAAAAAATEEKHAKSGGRWLRFRKSD